MRYQITHAGDDVEIQVQDTGESAPQLLAALQECRDGRCGCPTDQYDRLADMAIQVGTDEVAVHLHAREGEPLDVGQLQSCLDYTITAAQADGD